MGNVLITSHHRIVLSYSLNYISVESNCCCLVIDSLANIWKSNKFPHCHFYLCTNQEYSIITQVRRSIDLYIVNYQQELIRKYFQINLKISSGRFLNTIENGEKLKITKFSDTVSPWVTTVLVYDDLWLRHNLCQFCFDLYCLLHTYDTRETRSYTTSMESQWHHLQ